MAQDNARLAREHATKAEEYTKQAGQHTASAASTIGHDLRAAGDQLAEAGKYVGARLTAPVEGENVRDKAARTVDHSGKYVDAKADEAADATKSTYYKIKDSIGGFFGGAKESAERTGSAAADKTQDVAHKAADVVNRGVDKAHEGQRSVYESTPSQREVHAQGKEAYESAKDAAVQTKDAVVGGLQYVGGRLTAPVSGSEAKDRELADAAKDKTRSAADAVAGGARAAREQTGDAAERAQQQGKGLFASIKDAFTAPPEHEPEAPKGADLHAKATGAISSLEDQAKGAYHNVQDKMTQVQEDAKRQMREAQESLEPRTHTEAVLAEGGIPSNTADLLAARAAGDDAEQSAHESMQGQHISVEDMLDKTAEAWGGDHLTGDGNLDSIRNAADAAGPHSTHR